MVSEDEVIKALEKMTVGKAAEMTYFVQIAFSTALIPPIQWIASPK